ncbi:MAG: hypothetical protein JXR97_16225, partial [Planctomycetes bacterium]|nr:hypothetical protein [Planctomycetota bacterium]
MPLSTSSSNKRMPEMGYLRLWVGVLAVFALTVFSLEVYLRHKGCTPQIYDSKVLWSFHRSDVYSENGKKRIVIAGASRALLDIVPSVLQDSFPEYKVKMLAIDGSPAYETVKSLCEDPDFDGVILWSALSPTVFPAGDEYKYNKTPEYNRYYNYQSRHTEMLDKYINCLIDVQLGSRLVLLSKSASLKNLFSKKPKQPYIAMNLDRSISAYYKTRMTEKERQKLKDYRIHIEQGRSHKLDYQRFADFAENELS